MTKSSVPSIPTPPVSSPVNPPASPPETRPKHFSWGRATATLMFRLLLAGVGASVAAAIGIAFAQLYPSQAEQIPLVEKLLQQPEELWLQIRQLPERWNQSEPQPAESPAPNPGSVQPVVPMPSLSDSERQQLQTELTQLQAELQTLTRQSTEPLAERVQEIQKRIQSIQTKLSSFTEPAPAEVPAITNAGSAPVNHSANQLVITLPSDALFEPGSANLRPTAEAILSNLLTDLQGYSGASVLVGAHVNQQGTAEADRQKSLEQAKAVQQFLATRLDTQLNWMPIGYGHTRPLAPETVLADQPRNRRIEIVIQP